MLKKAIGTKIQNKAKKSRKQIPNKSASKELNTKKKNKKTPKKIDAANHTQPIINQTVNLTINAYPLLHQKVKPINYWLWLNGFLQNLFGNIASDLIKSRWLTLLLILN